MKITDKPIENVSNQELLANLKALDLVFSDLTKNIGLKEDKIKKQEQELEKYSQEIKYLKHQIEQYKRILFGTKSERFLSNEILNQLTLPFEINQEEVAQEVEKVKETITYEREKTTKKHPGRMVLPSHLPVNEIFVEPTENVEGLKCIGQEITDELEHTPAKFVINRYIRNKYIKPQDEQGKQEILIGSLDFRPIPKCIAGPGLLSQILVEKFIDHLPLYRQLQRFEREGIKIPSSTLESWVRLTSQLLIPLYECHRQQVMRNGYIQADESPIKVQDKDKKGATHTGYMWVYHAPMLKSVLFDYRKGRSGEFPLEMLRDFEGYLQTDGYAGYNKVVLNDKITHLGCWAHARRYFEKALDYNQEDASWVMKQIQLLYNIERQLTENNNTEEEKKEIRIAESLPILNEIGKFISERNKTELPKSPLGKAFNYCLERWDTLLNYLYNGNLNIDNNWVENAIRPLALGRKNYLFAGSHDAATHIAMYYSFFATCKKNNINPTKWLCYVLKNINNTKINMLHNLLPQNINPDLLD